MEIRRAGDPRLEQPAEARVGVSHVCVVPIAPAPNEEWTRHFKQSLSEHLQRFRGDSHTDAWSQHVRLEPDAVRFFVSGAVGARLGEYLDLINGVIRLTNERYHAAAESKTAARNDAEERAASQDQKVTSALREWAARNPS